MTKKTAEVLAQSRATFHGYLSGSSRNRGRGFLWRVIELAPAIYTVKEFSAVFEELGNGEEPIPPKTVDRLVEMAAAVVEAKLSRKKQKATR